MSHQRVHALCLALGLLLLVACGTPTPGSSDPDGFAGAGGTTSGSGGTGGAHSGDGGPVDYVTPARGVKVDKIDLLFMIDNSSSMADKQEIMAAAIPQLVERLIEPKCIGLLSGRVVGPAVNGSCATGVLDFDPVKDIHIGIISSSLGSHGAAGVCDDALDVMRGRSDPHNDDRGHLLTRGVSGANVPTFNSKGFLNYNPAVAGALASAPAVAAPFAEMVKGVGQHGCGYEASLEAVYRFLIDPEPFSRLQIDTTIGGFGQAILQGTDTQLLEQRREFLRRDSLVSVVLVTDENDCSIVDAGQGFYSILPPVEKTGRSVLKHGTSKCLENPNDRCCFNCGAQITPSGCPPADTDAECLKGELTIAEDQPNVRCFNQKQRYGVDFLYPVQRYIDGFTNPEIPNRKGDKVKNPLFSDLSCPVGMQCWGGHREKARVLVTGIVGVPWQNIAVEPLELTNGYKTARQLRDDGTWSDILGDPRSASGPVLPRDPHMIESIQPRPGLPGPASSWRDDVKSGHEWDPSKDLSQPNGDLQYVCIFDLVSPRMCTQADDCDCFGPNIGDVQNPLCQNAQGAYSTTQLRAKAYPGLRILEVLRGLDDRAVVGSICPAQMADPNRQDFGYAPTVDAMIRRLRQSMRDECLPVALPIDPVSGRTRCALIEVFSENECNCEGAPGRRTAPEALLSYDIRIAGNCRCEIKQATGDTQRACRTQTNPPGNGGDGWCYVDPAQQSDASCNLLSGCAADLQRTIRYVDGPSAPRPGAAAFLNCDAQFIAPLPPRCQ
jgi:hypothetical protein